MKEELVFLEIVHGTDDYLRTVALRDEVLRRPLGLAFAADELAAEAGSFHLGGWLGGEVLACTVLEPLAADSVRLRQFAVRENFRGRGVGAGLLEFAERFAIGRGFVSIDLHARETAVPFYRKAGYVPQGVRFMEVTIPHLAMGKVLDLESNTAQTGE